MVYWLMESGNKKVVKRIMFELHGVIAMGGVKKGTQWNDDVKEAVDENDACCNDSCKEC